jgi:hypothetical protein
MGFKKHSSVAQLLAQEIQACGQQVFWDLISYMGFRECSSVTLLLAWLRRTKPANSRSSAA